MVPVIKNINKNGLDTRETGNRKPEKPTEKTIEKPIETITYCTCKI